MWLIRVQEALMWHVGANGPLQFACFVFPSTSCDNTPKNCLFQISSYTRPYVRIIPKKSKEANSPPIFIGNMKHTSQKGLLSDPSLPW